MTSQKQITANRRNAQKSTGPKTESGKTRSKRNALNHGLRAIDVVTPDEDPEAYDEFRQKLTKSLAPVGCAETELVERSAGCFWRLRRCARIEASVLRIIKRGVSLFDESLLGIVSKQEKKYNPLNYSIGLAFSGGVSETDALRVRPETL